MSDVYAVKELLKLAQLLYDSMRDTTGGALPSVEPENEAHLPSTWMADLTVSLVFS